MDLSKKSLLGCTIVVVAVPTFIVGMVYQTQRNLDNIKRLIANNPYAYHVRREIYNAFEMSEHDVAEIEDHGPLTRMQEIMKYGFPGLDDIRLYKDFVLSYDRRNRVAHWTYEHLRAACVAGSGDKPNYANRNYRGERRFVSLGNADNNGIHRYRGEFQADMNVPSLFRVDTTDYWNSGFDRGHLAAAGNHKCCQSDCDQTFYLTNIAPQVGKGFNRDAWNNLEIYVRELTERYGSVHVCTGTLYKPREHSNGKRYVEYEVIGAHTVAVPTHFFKVVIIESTIPNGSPYLEAYLMPNAYISESTDLRSFLVDIREIERYAGLQFLNNIRRSFFSGINYATEAQLYDNFH